MNGFEKHGLTHLSASSINLYASAPDVWVVSYLFGRKTPMGPAPWRGICVEDAVVQILMGDSETAAIDQALAKFDKRFPIGDEKTSAERRRIQPMTQLAIEELMEFGKPEFPEDASIRRKRSASQPRAKAGRSRSSATSIWSTRSTAS
jgi:hypothetical protein